MNCPRCGIPGVYFSGPYGGTFGRCPRCGRTLRHVRHIEGGSHMTDYLRNEVLERDNHLCVRCHTKGNYHGYEITDDTFLVIHHVDADRAHNVLSNLEILCLSCHRKLHNEMKHKAVQ